jgi:predicted protein tyrosine phosphatase
MNNKLHICGVEKLEGCSSLQITQMIRITNPGANISVPSWFKGECLHLSFGDVISAADAAAYNTKAPDTDDIYKALNFARGAWRNNNSRLLVSCDYGASRSPALAYVLLADRLGAGNEHKAFNSIIDIRPEAVPNDMVVRLGDKILGRNGKLRQPLIEFYDEVNSWLENI